MPSCRSTPQRQYSLLLDLVEEVQLRAVIVVAKIVGLESNDDRNSFVPETLFKGCQGE